MPVLIADTPAYLAAWDKVPLALRKAYVELPRPHPNEQRRPTKHESEVATRLWDATYAILFAKQIAWCKKQGMVIKFLLPGDRECVMQYGSEDGVIKDYAGQRIAILALEDIDDDLRFEEHWGEPCRVSLTPRAAKVPAKSKYR